jgi:hypothetical protein
VCGAAHASFATLRCSLKYVSAIPTHQGFEGFGGYPNGPAERQNAGNMPKAFFASAVQDMLDMGWQLENPTTNNFPSTDVVQPLLPLKESDKCSFKEGKWKGGDKPCLPAARECLDCDQQREQLPKAPDFGGNQQTPRATIVDTTNSCLESRTKGCFVCIATHASFATMRCNVPAPTPTPDGSPGVNNPTFETAVQDMFDLGWKLSPTVGGPSDFRLFVPHAADAKCSYEERQWKDGKPCVTNVKDKCMSAAECNDRGKCAKGICFCNTGFAGDHCEQSMINTSHSVSH